MAGKFREEKVRSPETDNWPRNVCDSIVILARLEILSDALGTCMRSSDINPIRIDSRVGWGGQKIRCNTAMTNGPGCCRAPRLTSWATTCSFDAPRTSTQTGWRSSGGRAQGSGSPKPASGQQRSLANEAARQRFRQSATEDEGSRLPKYDDESDIGLLRALEQLRLPLCFDELVGNGFSPQENPASVTCATFTGWSTAVSGHTMRGGRHFVEFVINNDRQSSYIHLGVVRPVSLSDGIDLEAEWKGHVNPVYVSSHRKPAVAEKLRSQRTAKWGESNVHCCSFFCDSGRCLWTDWDNEKGSSDWQGQEGLRRSGTIGLLLDLDEGTLSVFKDGRRLGAMKERLGPLRIVALERVASGATDWGVVKNFTIVGSFSAIPALEEPRPKIFAGSPVSRRAPLSPDEVVPRRRGTVLVARKSTSAITQRTLATSRHSPHAIRACGQRPTATVRPALATTTRVPLIPSHGEQTARPRRPTRVYAPQVLDSPCHVRSFVVTARSVDCRVIRRRPLSGACCSPNDAAPRPIGLQSPRVSPGRYGAPSRARVALDIMTSRARRQAPGALGLLGVRRRASPPEDGAVPLSGLVPDWEADREGVALSWTRAVDSRPLLVGPHRVPVSAESNSRALPEEEGGKRTADPRPVNRTWSPSPSRRPGRGTTGVPPGGPRRPPPSLPSPRKFASLAPSGPVPVPTKEEDSLSLRRAERRTEVSASARRSEFDVSHDGTCQLYAAAPPSSVLGEVGGNPAS
ncbi:hypothetical protein THAOC_14872 [Thalassiosira oceanica]|uniref:B30.2/SPRY domain-containing protein n=1 Tax=Thalassiosira oceanica TaxID=159749 RepID=K0STP3_THAOC|nr:hypothetical protein THAOC_14872 [Thalassiosira oceanica]|eukprot:EJK64396.1 hypothetical protein THAOC_14872 [Thalassiosira oceanica]